MWCNPFSFSYSIKPYSNFLHMQNNRFSFSMVADIWVPMKIYDWVFFCIWQTDKKQSWEKKIIGKNLGNDLVMNDECTIYNTYIPYTHVRKEMY